MRPTPARILLSAIAIGSLAAGVLTSQLIFFVVALGASILLGTSLSTNRHSLTHAINRFRNHTVEVRLWGAPPPGLSGATLVLTSVSAIGAGAHVFFNVQGGGGLHLKVAQPQDASLAPECVVIGSPKYLQWNGKKLRNSGSAPAVAIALSEQTVRE
ncbi:MAG TPA: hypothetical protein VLE22_12670 [Bryobacteraceae bacterium]|nr:hypothetical protein [Bryobacteraceae bacterium]